MNGVTLGPRMLVPFRLVPEAASMSMRFRLHMLMMFTLLMYSMLSAGVDWYDSSTPQPLDPWRGRSPRRSTHRDALIRALSQIRVETTTTLKGLIHMVTVGRATCCQVPSVLLDNSSTLNVCPLATAIAIGYAPSDFGPTIFVTLFQSRAIPYSLHQKVKFIHDGQVVIVQSVGDMFISVELHSSTVVLDMMRGMSYLPGMGLGRRQHGPSEFMAFPDHDVPFGLRFIPTKVDYRYMMRLHKERVRAQLTHTPFDYTVHPYTLSLIDYFVRASEPHTPLDEIGDIVDGAVPHDKYVNEMLAMSLSQIEEIVSLELTSPFDLFGVLVEGASYFVDPPLSFDVLSGFVSRHDNVFDSLSMDLSIFEYLSTMHQPRELRIGHAGLDPSIVQHHLSLLPHADRLNEVETIPPSLEFAEIQKHFDVGFLSVVDKILMAPDDMENTSFITEWGTYWSIVADHLASLPVFDGRAIDDDFTDEDVTTVTSLLGWCMYFDGAANHSGYEIGVLLISPHGDQIPRFLLVGRFDDLRYTHLLRAHNQFADALATLVSMIDISIDANVPPLLIESRSVLAYCCLIDDTKLDDGLSWCHDVYHFLRLGVYPKVVTTKDKRALRQLAS
ncbi:hypothetical protein AAG906_029153 [Vitis piasezkii]